MSDSYFVDIKVLVYSADSSEGVKQPIARDRLEVLWQNRMGRVSAQVLQEYYVTDTTKLEPGMDDPAARSDVRDLMGIVRNLSAEASRMTIRGST